MKRSYEEFVEWQKTWGSHERDFYNRFLRSGGRAPAMFTTLPDEAESDLRLALINSLDAGSGIYLFPVREDSSFRSWEMFNLLMKETMLHDWRHHEHSLQVSLADMFEAITASDDDRVSLFSNVKYLFIEDFMSYGDDNWLGSRPAEKRRIRNLIVYRLYNPEQITFFRGLPGDLDSTKTKRSVVAAHCWDKDMLQLISKRTVVIGVG